MCLLSSKISPVVCYQAVRHGVAFYFVPKGMAKDAEKALSLFGKTKPSFYANLILVKEWSKFVELASKTSAGCANKSGKWRGNVTWLKNIGEAINNGFTILDRNLADAMGAPSQHSDEINGSWSCGPNSAYRARLLIGEKKYNYSTFVECCPKTFSKQKTAQQGTKICLVGTLAAALFASVTGGASLAAAAAIAAGSGAATAVVGTYIPDVGPKPEMLAAYLSNHMDWHEARYSGYSCQICYEKSIKRDICLGYPTIALIVSGTNNMHYINIVGFNSAGKSFLILDTDGSIGAISKDNLRHWLDRDGYANFLLGAKYNTVEFVRKCIEGHAHYDEKPREYREIKEMKA